MLQDAIDGVNFVGGTSFEEPPAPIVLTTPLVSYYQQFVTVLEGERLSPYLDTGEQTGGGDAHAAEIRGEEGQ